MAEEIVQPAETPAVQEAPPAPPAEPTPPKRECRSCGHETGSSHEKGCIFSGPIAAEVE